MKRFCFFSGRFRVAATLSFSLFCGRADAGSALAFDGTNDFVNFGTGLFPDVTNTFTIELWVKPTAARAWTSQATAGIPGNSDQRYAIFPEQGQVAYGSDAHAGVGISVGTNGISVFEHSANYIPPPLIYVGALNDWQHLAVVYSNHTPRLYLDGVLVRTGLISDKIVHPSVNLGESGKGYGYYQGLLDEVRVWKTALDSSTLVVWHNHELDPTHPAYADLVGYWRLNEGAGGFTADLSPRGNQGMLTNGPSWVTPGAPIAAAGSPIARADQITSLSDTSAVLNASANPQGIATTAWFEWGIGTNLDSATLPSPVGEGMEFTNLSLEITNLVPATPYNFRLGASNSLGLYRSAALPFITRGPPVAVTWPLTNPGALNADFRGEVAPYGHSTLAWFEWGATVSYGNQTVAQDAGGNFSSLVFTQSITGLLAGREYHFRCVASNASGIALGQDQSFRTMTFSNSYVGPWGDFHGSVSWQDYDREGDLDLLIMNGSFSNTFTLLLRNDSNVWFHVPALPNQQYWTSAGLPRLSAGTASWGDYDNDGDPDLLLSGGNYYQAYGIGDGTFVYRNTIGIFTNTFTGLTNVLRGAAAWGDYDKDGRLDFFATGDAGNQNIHNPTNALYRGNGDGTFTWVSNSIPAVFDGSIAWGDADNDGDLDLLIAGNTGTNIITRLFLNQAGTFADSGVVLPGVTSGSVAWGDYDNDGWPDILLGGSTNALVSGAICRIYHNNHDGSFTDIGAGLPGLFVGFQFWWGPDAVNAAWGDYDGDGQLDVLLSGVAPQFGAPAARIYRNNHGTFTDIGAGLPAITSGSAAWGDYDGDGRLDCVLPGIGLYWPTTLIYRNFLALPSDPPDKPTAPPVTLASVTNNSVTLSWTAATDPHTPAAGLTYNVRVGTNSGGGQIVTPQSDPLTGRRRLPQMGNAEQRLFTTLTNLPIGQYYWSVQAVNQGFAGSPWSVEQSFVVTNQPAIVATLPASNVLCCSALLMGSVIPGGSGTTAWFDWGTNESFGLTTAPLDVGAGLQSLPLQQPVSGLLPLTTYFYRLVASNSAGLALGTHQSFTTAGPAPLVSTLGPSNVLWTTASLFGTSPLTSPGADYYVEWGATMAYDNLTPAAMQDAALLFDGVDDCVEVGWGKFPAATNNFTIELWVHPTAARSTTSELTSGAAGTGGQRYAVFPEQGTVAYGGSQACAGLSVGTNGISVMEHTGGALPSVLVLDTNLTGWSHIALVYSNHVPLLVLNGMLVRTGLVSSLPVHPSAAFGGVTDPTWSGMGPYAGDLQELRIWDTPLDTPTIQFWMNQGVSPSHPAYPHLQGYWALKEGRGTNIADSSPGNHPGQLFKGTAWTGGRNSSARVFWAELAGLTPGATYHFRAVATNAGGTVYGSDQTFTLLPRPNVQEVITQGPPGTPGSLLRFSGTAGLRYDLEASTNLLDWLTLTNLVAGPDGAFEFLDASATNFPVRFYRLRVP